MDWLRMVYQRMEYAVKQSCQEGVDCTMPFRSLWGILAGDTASPGLFTYYFSDFRPPPDVDDLILSGCRISNVEHADDVALFILRGVRAIQGKLDYMHLDWCATNFLAIAPPKSKGMIFGPIPSVLPTLSVGDECLEFVDEFKYIGVTFKSTHRFVFAPHYVKKASKAQNMVFATFAVESMVGTLPPREGLQLYKSRIDPHLTFASEVAIDIDGSFLALLEDVQVLFLHGLLGLHKRSMRALLFTETGIMPISYRHIILALRYLQYLLKLPAHHYTHAAFDDACLLHVEKKPSWVGDIAFVLSHLPVPVLLKPVHLANPDSNPGLIAEVKASCVCALQSDINESEKAVLLKNRTSASSPVKLSDVLQYRHYLDVVVPVHCKALTWLLTSCHALAVNSLWWDPLRRRHVPWELRVCCFCHSQPEDECHAMLYCVGSQALTQRRGLFFSDAQEIVPGVQAAVLSLPPPDSLRYLVGEE